MVPLASRLLPALTSRSAEGLLEREPTFVGTEEWWDWLLRLLPQTQPLRAQHANWQRWKTRVETNPFPIDSAQWRRWREGCCAAAAAGRVPVVACAVRLLGASSP